MSAKDRPHIVVQDLGRAPLAGGVPVSLVDGSSGRVVGQYANVIDATHALHSYGGEGASGAYDDMDAVPDGTPVPANDGPHYGPDFHDDRTPGISTFAGAYGEDPSLTGGAAGSITTPGHIKPNTTPQIQVWEAEPNATLNPTDLQPSAPVTHPKWMWPHDPNA